MNRKEFLKKGLLGTGIFAGSISGFKALANAIDEITPLEHIPLDSILGFNHIQHTNSNIMDHAVLHLANSRGLANHGWLKSYHTFSFANYYNPDRMHFGVLRVLNDDEVAAGMGFGKHPHDNMEIISIPLSGDLRHNDSMGNEAIIRNGDVQIMSAGTGIIHSEYNNREIEKVKFLQIWVYPNQKNVTPRYDQMTINNVDLENNFLPIISPFGDEKGLSIHQNAWFYLSNFNDNFSKIYSLNDPKNNGIYVFILSGSIIINEQQLNERDGIGIWNINEVNIKSINNASFLIMEVPMHL